MTSTTGTRESPFWVSTDRKPKMSSSAKPTIFVVIVIVFLNIQLKQLRIALLNPDINVGPRPKRVGIQRRSPALCETSGSVGVVFAIFLGDRSAFVALEEGLAFFGGEGVEPLWEVH